MIAARKLLAATILFASTPMLASFAQVPEVDLLIKNGQVIDGSGGPRMQADVAISGDKIVYVGRAPVKAKKVIDASGQVVTPGFIDMHLSLIHISEPTRPY